jgi:membrane protein implicated in regulation of membrane protease activity
MNLNDWWEALSLLQKVYWLIASVSTLIFVILLGLMFIGGDSEGVDFDHDGDVSLAHADSIDLFSLKSILAFLMFFGWSGLAAISLGMKFWWFSLGISFVIGFIMMFFTAWVIMLLYSLQQDGTMKINKAVGLTGEVYISIPPKMQGQGKVEILLNGSYKTLDAVTRESQEIKINSMVQVIDVEGDTLVVILSV